MRMKFIFLSALAIVPIFASTSANAALLNFELTGSRSAMFQLDSNPTPTSGSEVFPGIPSFGDQIQFTNISGTFGGVAGTATIGFGRGLAASFQILSANLGFSQFAGPSIYSGTFSAPVFSPGTFALTSIVSGNSTLTISQATGAVPEPASWAMMIAGFGAIGAAMRRRQRVAVSFG